jgi:ATP-dependent RNA helicase RhlE
LTVNFFYRSKRRRPVHRRNGPERSSGPASSTARQPASRSTPTPELSRAIAASPFTNLGLVSDLVRSVVEEGYVDPTPVQREVIPHALAGKDVLASAQTGTGKTAAFVLPTLQLLSTRDRQRIRALILTPTRELAVQIADQIAVYGRHVDLQRAVVYGGVSQRRQEVALSASPDILVATPGRLLDLVSQGLVRLGGVTHFVLDEADRMLDMGFVHDVRRVVAALPSVRQTLFFSATFAPSVEELARTLLANPVRVAISPSVHAAPSVDQSVVFVSRAEKRALLEDMLRDASVERALVFTRTKHAANRLSEQLLRSGIRAAAIHGNKSQAARERALESFRRGATRVLVATDVAARGIDVDAISLVVNFDLPQVPESYVHRIGRTGRAGASGRAISFCDRDERPLLVGIERLIRQRLAVAGDPGRAARTRAA